MEELPTVTLLEFEVEMARKVRTIKRLIFGWSATMVGMATILGVIAYA